MTRFLTHWATTAVSLGVCVWIVPGVRVESFGALVVAALVLGFLNAIVRPILLVLTLPITILTLGLFYFILNGLMFGLASELVPGFVVSSFGAAVVGALVLSLVSWFIGCFAGAPRRSPDLR